MRLNRTIGMVFFLAAATCMAAGDFSVFSDGFKGPENMAFDGKGGLYVSDTDHLWLADAGGDKKELYARDPEKDSISLGGVSLGPGGKVYFSTGNAIKIYDPADGAVSGFVSGFNFANGNCFDDAGDFFIADSNACTLFVVPAGTKEVKVLKDKLGSAAGVGVNGVVWSRADNTLYYTVNLPTRVGGLKLGPGPAVAGEVTIIKFPLGGLDDLMLDRAGNFYVCMWLNGKVVKVSPDGKKETLLDKLDGPSSLEFAPGTGDLYITIKGGSTRFEGTQVIKVKTDSAAYKLPFMP